jgi:hypothetical protein
VRWFWLGACALLLGVVLVLVRGEPRSQSDQGVFLSVAARMLDGDHLYADVVDNKDPLFFYTYAGALWAAGWKAPFLLDGLWLALAFVSVALMLRQLRAPPAAVVAGAVVYPLALTADWYEPGLSMLAALAIAPLAGWLWLRGNFAAAGACLGGAMLFKLNLAPTVAGPVAAFVVLGTPAGSRLRQLVRAALGLASALGAAAVWLAARGELVEYVETIGYNVGYSRRVLGAETTLDAIDGHVRIVREYFEAAGKWQAPAALLAVGAFAGATAVGWPALRRSSLQLVPAAAAATLAATLATLALTAVWAHHLQMLAYAGALMAASGISLAFVWLGHRGAAVAAAACVLFAAWASVGAEIRAGLSVQPWSSDPLPEPAASLDRMREQHYPGRDPVTYMVFGGVSENAHAAFIDDSFDLSCRWFHLYPFSVDEQFDETLDCFDRERPKLVLVTLGFFDRTPPSAWASFVSQARRRLEARYEKVSDVYPGFQVWKLREPESDG